MGHPNIWKPVLNVSTDWFERIDLDMYFNTNDDLRQQQLAMNPLGHLSDFFGKTARSVTRCSTVGSTKCQFLANTRRPRRSRRRWGRWCRWQPLLQRHPLGRHHF